LHTSTLLTDGTFGPATLIPELNSVAADPGVMVRFDGLEAFFYSGRSGGIGGQDLWTATRETIFDAWSAPENLGPLLNSAGIDQRPYVASDRQTLFFWLRSRGRLWCRGFVRNHSHKKLRTGQSQRRFCARIPRLGGPRHDDDL
jgi:hypothetical protein